MQIKKVVVTVITEAKTVLALWRAVGELTGRIDNGLGAVHGLGLAEFVVLHLLAEAPGQSMRRIDLADALGRTASGVTRMQCEKPAYL
ncbi:MAG: DNA-binding MarR family transcriptional regulator [Gammaproteobacteria bacterium]|jgi:DNA-binding MarR family transcriptional regulator